MNNPPSDITPQKNDELLSLIQSDFPIVTRPYKVVADRIGLTEREVIDSIRSFMETDVIRTLGPVFEARRLGYVSTLIAAKVDDDRVSELATAMLDMNEITHSYLRDNELNLWFTVTAINAERMEEIIAWVKKFPGVNRVINLPMKKVFKINAVWGTGKSEVKNADNSISVQSFDETGKKLVRALQNNFPVVGKPFSVIANSMGESESAILEIINNWLKNGTIRRFGARLNHRKIGYTHNILTAWKGKNSELWSEKFAGFDFVSHCYLRESHDDWPYELYTMIHAKSSTESRKNITTMKTIAQGAQMVEMKTLFELKKTSMKYFMED